MKTLLKMILICLLCTVYSCKDKQNKLTNKNIIIGKTEFSGKFYKYAFVRTYYKDTMYFYYPDSTFRNGDNVGFDY